MSTLCSSEDGFSASYNCFAVISNFLCGVREVEGASLDLHIHPTWGWQHMVGRSDRVSQCNCKFSRHTGCIRLIALALESSLTLKFFVCHFWGELPRTFPNCVLCLSRPCTSLFPLFTYVSKQPARIPLPTRLSLTLWPRTLSSLQIVRKGLGSHAFALQHWASPRLLRHSNYLLNLSTCYGCHNTLILE